MSLTSDCVRPKRCANSIDKLAAHSSPEFKSGKSISSQVPPGVEVTYYLMCDINPSATGLNITSKQDKRPIFKLE